MEDYQRWIWTDGPCVWDTIVYHSSTIRWKRCFVYDLSWLQGMIVAICHLHANIWTVFSAGCSDLAAWSSPFPSLQRQKLAVGYNIIPTLSISGPLQVPNESWRRKLVAISATISLERALPMIVWFSGIYPMGQGFHMSVHQRSYLFIIYRNSTGRENLSEDVPLKSIYVGEEMCIHATQ
jgi:hypothetical protein